MHQRYSKLSEMLRCAPSKIRLTIDDIEEAQQRAGRAAADRSTVKPLQPRALNISSILTTPAHELQVKHGPGHARDDALIQAKPSHVSSSAVRASIEDDGRSSSRALKRTRHSIHVTRRHNSPPRVRRSRSHSSGSGILSGTGKDAFQSPLWLTSTTVITKECHRPNPTFASLLSTPPQNQVVEDTEIPLDKGPEELAETGFVHCEQLEGAFSNQNHSSPVVKFDLESPRVPSRHSSLAWKGSIKDDALSPNSETFDSDSDESHSSIATCSRPLSNDAFVRETSPLEDLANRLRQLAATPCLRDMPSSRSRSSSLNASPRLLSGDLFYGRSEGAASDYSRQDIPRMPHRPTQTTRLNGMEHARLRSSRHDHTDDFLDRAADHGTAYAQSPSEFILGTSPLLASALSMSLPTATTQPVTPNNARETGFTRRDSVNHQKPIRTPRLRIYDDVRPAPMQPQTPADLMHRHRTIGDPTKSVPSKRRMSETARDPISFIVPSDSRYPSLQNFPSTYDLRSRVFVSTGHDSGRPSTHSAQAQRRKMHHSQSVENDHDTDAAIMEEERRARTSHGVGHSAVGTLEATPPGMGRSERHLR